VHRAEQVRPRHSGDAIIVSPQPLQIRESVSFRPRSRSVTQAAHTGTVSNCQRPLPSRKKTQKTRSRTMNSVAPAADGDSQRVQCPARRI
jgi:hypothetical protein